MSRKTGKKVSKAPKAAAGASAAARPRRGIGKKAVAALVACLLLGATFAATRVGPLRRAVGLGEPGPAPQSSETLSLSKEYIYAGGRLVATEDAGPVATPTPGGPSPSGAVALLASVTGPSAGVNVSWTPPSSGPQVGSYAVERKTAGGDFTQVGQAAATDTTYADTAPEGAAYLYRVKALYAGGGGSGYSNADLVTTVAFTDDPLIGMNDAQGRPATFVYARHLTELRRAVSAVHSLAGLGGVTSWTHADPVSSPAALRRAISLEDVQNLRDRLGEALRALSIAEPTYLDGTLARYSTKVKKEHFQQLRDAVK